MKRTKVLLLAVAGMNILNCSAQPKDLDNYEYVVDSNVKRKVTIMVYNAIPSGEKNNKGDIAFSFLMDLNLILATHKHIMINMIISYMRSTLLLEKMNHTGQ